MTKENSFIIQLFYIQLCNEFECKCGYKTYSFEKKLDIPIYLPENNKNYDFILLLNENLKDIIEDWEKNVKDVKRKIYHTLKK